MRTVDIGKRLQELRLAKGFSQGDIERQTGLLRCYVSRVENGYTNPNLQILDKWAKAIDMDLHRLFQPGVGTPATPEGPKARPLSTHSLV